MECRASGRRAAIADNRRTSCEKDRSVRWRGGATRSNQDIFSSRHNNKAVPRTRSGAQDASAKNGLARWEFPSVDCRRRLLFREIQLDTTRATFQMHRYPDRNHRCARRSSRANASEEYVSRVRRGLPAQERSKFYLASAYHYSGERGASKVSAPIEMTRCI